MLTKLTAIDRIRSQDTRHWGQSTPETTTFRGLRLCLASASPRPCSLPSVAAPCRRSFFDRVDPCRQHNQWDVTRSPPRARSDSCCRCISRWLSLPVTCCPQACCPCPYCSSFLFGARARGQGEGDLTRLRATLLDRTGAFLGYRHLSPDHVLLPIAPIAPTMLVPPFHEEGRRPASFCTAVLARSSTAQAAS